jgi:RNA polymerase sigma-70 factor (ECF subfamily)
MELLSQYLDVELPAGACREIEEHLSGCSPCEEFAESLRKTVALCRSYRMREMPRPIGDRARADLLAAFERFTRSEK